VTLGYGDATMAAIADAADIHITTLFTHFASKRDLAAAIAGSRGRAFEEVVTMQRAQGVPVLSPSGAIRWRGSRTPMNAMRWADQPRPARSLESLSCCRSGMGISGFRSN